MWFLDHVCSSMPWRIHSIVYLTHTARQRWNYPWASINAPSIYHFVKNLKRPFWKLLTRNRHYILFARFLQLLLTIAVRVHKRAVVVPYHLCSCYWKPRKASLSIFFLCYWLYLRKHTGSSTVNSKEWLKFVHIQSCPTFLLHRLAEISLGFRNSSSLPKYVLRLYKISGRDFSMGESPSETFLRPKSCCTLIPSTAPTYIFTDLRTCSCPSKSESLLKSCQAYSNISCDILLVTWLGLTLYPTNHFFFEETSKQWWPRMSHHEHLRPDSLALWKTARCPSSMHSTSAPDASNTWTKILLSLPCTRFLLAEASECSISYSSPIMRHVNLSKRVIVDVSNHPWEL